MRRVGIKRKPTYKQMAFETAVRNPERYIEIFTALKNFDGVLLNNENLFGLDINSGVETSPGIKSSEKLNQVFSQIRNY